jgi:hypothetical protein
MQDTINAMLFKERGSPQSNCLFERYHNEKDVTKLITSFFHKLESRMAIHHLQNS